MEGSPAKHHSAPERPDEAKEYPIEVIYSLLTGDALMRSHIGDELTGLRNHMLRSLPIPDDEGFFVELGSMAQSVIDQHGIDPAHLTSFEDFKALYGETLTVRPI